MLDILRPQKLELDALYLGLLAARRIKPLSRLEYPVSPDVLGRLQGLGLVAAPVRQVAQNGARLTHWVLGTDPATIRQYQLEYEGTTIGDSLPGVIRSEARYFGYPPCCAEAFIREPYAPNDLAVEEQALLFHHACPGCQVTPRLLPLYRAALAEARRLHEGLRRSRGGVKRLTAPLQACS